MKEELDARINLPLTPSMYAAIKTRAAEEQMSAVSFIRRCIDEGLKDISKVNDLEARMLAVEELLHGQMKKKNSGKLQAG